MPNNADPVGKRDNPPGLSSEVFLGYERPAYIDREGPEKFAAIDTTRCTLGSARAQELSRAVLLASPAIRNTIFAILFVFAQDFFRNSRAIEPLY